MAVERLSEDWAVTGSLGRVGTAKADSQGVGHCLCGTGFQGEHSQCPGSGVVTVRCIRQVYGRISKPKMEQDSEEKKEKSAI